MFDSQRVILCFNCSEICSNATFGKKIDQNKSIREMRNENAFSIRLVKLRVQIYKFRLRPIAIAARVCRVCSASVLVDRTTVLYRPHTDAGLP